MAQGQQSQKIERWGLFEIAYQGPSGGNPFVEVTLSAVFRHASKSVRVDGFFDGVESASGAGRGVFRLRFMPNELGRWDFTTESNAAELDRVSGSFECAEPTGGNHGPVSVSRGVHFSYADGTPFFVMGTTAYAWTYRPEEVRRQSLESFSRYDFNKIRMLVFPKHYGDGAHVDISYEPPTLPFEGSSGHFDFARPNPAYFRNLEERVLELQSRGIEADVILFHTYDSGQWGIDTGMAPEDDFRYLRYVIARLSAYRNVWWSLGNEYDLFVEPEQKGRAFASLHGKDWDRIGGFVRDLDPYHHLISAHNLPFGYVFPDAPWLTHVSYQHPNTYSLLIELRREYAKPVIDDEYQYEGNVPHDWGNCSPETEVYRHWLTAMAGGYGTHGEAYVRDGRIRDIFWSYGGEMTGGSPSRLRYMKSIMESLPFQEMLPDLRRGDGRDLFCLRKGEDTYVFFITKDRKDRGMLFIGPPDGLLDSYEVVIHDAWNAEVHSTLTVRGGINRFDLPELAAIVVRRLP